MGSLDKLREKDNFWIGFILGLVLPLAIYPFVRPTNPQNFSFIADTYRHTMLKLLPMLLSRCIFPNALLFFIFIWGNFNLAAKGILYVSIGLVVILIFIEFIF